MPRPPARFLVAALAVLCAGAVVAQSPRPATPRPAQAPVRPDSLAADSAARRPVVVRPPTATEAAMGRLRAAVARGIAPRGPFPALDARLAGVSWIVPTRRAAAVDDLVAMRRAGVRAVRTGLVADTLLLRAASTLGIALYQDLPAHGLPAAYLLLRGDAAERLLAGALERGRPYAAARHYGLATACDTSDPRVRPYFERLTAVAHAAGARTYYTTRFPRSDLAAGTVDLVLLDAPDGDPAGLLARWRSRSATPAGLASVGPGAVPGRDGGWRTPGSAAAQARALEDALGALLSLPDPPAATFVGLWRDAPEDARRGPATAVGAGSRAEVSGVRAGLRDERGRPRPAAAVAAGFFTGTQRVFAFDAGPSGDRAPRDTSALLVLGWILVLGLGLFMVGAPRLATLVPRYFGRHDLFREAVQRGYDLSAGQTALLGLGLTAAVGVVGAAALRALGRTDALAAATAAWSPAAQGRLVGLLGHPLGLVAGLALGYAAYLLVTLVWLNALAGRRRVRAGQALSVVVWSRWAWLPLMALALLLAGVGPQTATALAPALLGLGVLAETVAGYRTMLDFSSVTRVPPARALLVGFGVPFALALATLVWIGTTARPEAAFVWHLATRG